MDGRVCIVTGSNSGIGKETARALAGIGATVVMVVRNKEKGIKALNEIQEETGNHETAMMICDVSSRSSIQSFVEEFSGSYENLHVLINNAGAVYMKKEFTPDGFEKTFATNYLGPFLLSRELQPLLEVGAPSRIINVSSGMHKTGKMDFDDLQSLNKFGGMKVYANTKLMVTTMTYELARRLEGTGVTANVVEPGFVATNLGMNSGSLMSALMFTIVRPMQKSPKKGAETSIWAATAPELENVTGKCFANKQEISSAKISYDGELQIRLWEVTEEMLKKT